MIWDSGKIQRKVAQLVLLLWTVVSSKVTCCREKLSLVQGKDKTFWGRLFGSCLRHQHPCLYCNDCSPLQHSMDSWANKTRQIHQNAAFCMFAMLFYLPRARWEIHIECDDWQAIKRCNTIKASNYIVKIAICKVSLGILFFRETIIILFHIQSLFKILVPFINFKSLNICICVNQWQVWPVINSSLDFNHLVAIHDTLAT